MRKKIKILCLIAIILFLILGMNGASKQWPFTVIGGDFAAYWSSTRLLINGQNPYQADQIFALQKSVGSTDKTPTMMYSPPWIFAFIIPFALDNYPLAKLFWILFITICTLFCSVWLWRFYGGKDKDRIWLLLIIFTYIPIYLSILRGQIIPLILLGLIGFLHFEKQKKWFLAGIFICLLGIKPQDSYLFLIALLFWIIYKKQWAVILGILFITFFIITIPLLYNPEVYSQYYREILIRSYHYNLNTPTLGNLMRYLLGNDKYYLQYCPTIIGIAWLLYHWHRNYTKWVWSEQTPLLIFISLMTTFYVWINDYMLLIIAIIQASICIIHHKPARSIFVILLYVIINLMAWITVLFAQEEKLILWMIPALFINYLLIKRKQIFQIIFSNI